MDINDPFGFKRLQTMVNRTQKAVKSIQVVSEQLSKDSDNTSHKPALSSIADSMQAAVGQLEKIGDGIKKADVQVKDVSAKAADFDRQIRRRV